MTHATRRRLLAATAFLVALSLGAAAPRRRPTPPPPFEQSIEVVETSILVAPPVGLRRMADRDWEVIEDGNSHRAHRVELLAGEPWELVIWVDGPLCAQPALARTMLALAHQGEALTALGTVRVVVADPAPRTVLAATREPAVVVQALATLSSQELCSGEPDALFWQARGMPRGAPANPALATAAGAAEALSSLRTLVERRAAMLAEASTPCSASAGCALLLVSHGFPLDADLRLPPELRPADSSQLAAALAAATEGLARRLAVSRWLLVALPFAPPPPEGEAPESERTVPKGARPGPEPFPDMGDTGPPGAPAPIRRLPKIAPPAAATDVYILPELAPLRRVANLTAGAVLRVPEQLPPLFEALAGRRRLWYRTTPFAPGESRSVEVRVRDRHAEAPAWIGRAP